MTARVADDGADDARAAAGGDERAFARLVRSHEGAIYRLMLGQTGDAAEARDLAQETFLRAFRHVDRLAEVDSPRAWLSRVALNVARDWRRRRLVRRLVGWGAPFDPAALLVDNGDPPIEEVVDARDALSAAWRAIALLPASLRDPLLLCAVDGMSQAEAAGVLGISVKAVELRVRRGRIALAERLGRDRRPRAAHVVTGEKREG